MPSIGHHPPPQLSSHYHSCPLNTISLLGATRGEAEARPSIIMSSSDSRRRPILAKGAMVCWSMVMTSSLVAAFHHLPSQTRFPRLGGVRSLKAAGKDHVGPNDNVWVNVDNLMTHDVCGPGTIGIFKKEFGNDAKVSSNVSPRLSSNIASLCFHLVVDLLMS